MADKKISQLTAATTPLAGTEVLPVVQGGTTVKVSVDNLTAGKAVSASALTLTGGVANAVAYLNASKAVTTGGVLLFDGSNLGVGATPVYKVDVVSPAGAQNMFRVGQSGVSNGFVISSDGTNLSYQFDTGNLVQGTAAKGINFSANTGAAGKTSSLLNWYEEGTWTPSLSRINASGFSYTPGTNDKGYYTRIGNIVHVFGSFDGTFSGGSDLYRITQLPFNQKTGISYVGSVGHIINISAGADVGPLAAVGSNVSVAEIYTGNPTSGNIHTFSLTYFV